MEQALGLFNHYTENGIVFVAVVLFLITLSLVSLLLFIGKLFQIFKKKPAEHIEAEVAPDDIAVVINKTTINLNGKKLKYFILKETKDSVPAQQILAVGTKVKVLKKTSTEAYVKPI